MNSGLYFSAFQSKKLQLVKLTQNTRIVEKKISTEQRSVEILHLGVVFFDLPFMRSGRVVKLIHFISTYQCIVFLVAFLLRFNPKFSDFILADFDFELSFNYFNFQRYSLY